MALNFSQRRMLAPVRLDLQREGIDDALRNKLWSALYLAAFNADRRRFARSNEDAHLIARRLWIQFFQGRVDEQPAPHLGIAGLGDEAKRLLLRGEWNRVYDFVEAVAEELEGTHRDELADLINECLQQEQSTFRLVGTTITDIVDEEQLKAVERALEHSSPLASVQAHLRSAVDLYSDRRAPHYANSIKESISAVEALCQVLSGRANASLGDAIKRLKEEGIKLHPALEHAWLKLYGYTSDSGGIRHALSGEPTVTQSDARYMLITCSAFVSHLISLAAESKIDLASR